MGQVLDKPVTEKRYEHGEGNGLSFSVASMQGWRLDMEDAHAALPVFHPSFPNVSYFAVFDGHAGAYTSTYCAERLHETVYETLVARGVTAIPETMSTQEQDTLCSALSEAFVKFDDDLKASEPYTSGREGCGTTALCVLVTPHHIVFANCGDSRGFLARNGDVLFQTRDHKPSDTEERKRIEDSGGSVIMDRVNGNLAVSRAIGDFSFKDKTGISTREQAVSPEPTVTLMRRLEEQFLVLACDGIWDVMSCEKVRIFFETKMQLGVSLGDICTDLINACLLLDSRDNMTCLVVRFPHATTVNPEEVAKDAEFNAQLEQKTAEYVEKHAAASTLTGLVEFLNTQTFPLGISSSLGAQSKAMALENMLDRLAPHRNKEKDYQQAQMPSNFPMSFQAIQQLVKREPLEEMGSSPGLIETISDDAEESMD